MSDFIITGFADEIDKNLDIQISELKRLNISYLELRGVGGKMTNLFTLIEAEDIKRRLDENGIKISAVASPIGKIMITDDFEPHFETFKRIVEICKIMQTRYMRIFSFFIPKGEDANKYEDEVLKRTKTLIDYARKHDIILLHENEKDIYGDIPERCLNLMKKLGCANYRAIFDFANFIQCKAQTYPHGFELLKPYIEYIHVKDAFFSDGTVVPAGMGDGKIPEILSILYKEGYKGFLSLEPHLGSFAGLEQLEGENFKKTEKSGPEKFEIAVNALRGIIEKIINQN